MTDDRMTGAELRARREYLGIIGGERIRPEDTPEQVQAKRRVGLAGRLGVREDTLRRWEHDREPIPVRVREQLAAVETETAEHVDDIVAILRQAAREPLADGWQGAIVDRAQPTIRAYGMRWWRHIVIRAADQVPDADIAGLLVIPAHWRDAPGEG